MDFVSAYIIEKVLEWQRELQQLPKVASTEPHAAYAALTHGLRSRWIYLLCTLEFLTYQQDALDSMINQQLLPALGGRRFFSDEELCLLQFPCWLGGILAFHTSRPRLQGNSKPPVTLPLVK